MTTATCRRALTLAIRLGLILGTFVRAGTLTGAEPKQDLPDWIRRGNPTQGHAALEPLIGTWHVLKSIYGTMGRTPDLPPIISEEIITRRQWVAGGHFIEDVTEGRIEGKPYWRKGWLGYSNMDHRYEWVTIDPINTTMMAYYAKSDSGDHMPIEMTGVFTDQGVVSEKTVGKAVGQRTVIRIESNDRHVFELYFTPSGGPEQLADRTIYTRMNETNLGRGKAAAFKLPNLPEPVSGETGPFCLIAKHRARPGKADAYLKRMLADVPATRAEPGALQFHIHRDRSDPNLIVLYEVWKDVSALREHFDKSFVQKFVADANAEFIDGGLETQWLRMVTDYVPGK